jgi:hypothetical protein
MTLRVGKARYDYTCETCGLPIAKGTRYASDVMCKFPWEGPRKYRAKNKRCLGCAIADPTVPAETAGLLSEIRDMILEQARGAHA